MKVSGFTFIKNAEMLGYPFIESIQSVLPIVDEFIIAVGKIDEKLGTNISKKNYTEAKI